MAEGITIRITGDDSEFLQTLASLESEAQGHVGGAWKPRPPPRARGVWRGGTGRWHGRVRPRAV